MAVDKLHIGNLNGIDPQSPVVMLNLMKFRARAADGNGTGWDAYLRYSALTVPMIKARGGTLLWTGRARGVVLDPQHGGEWDYVALVRYPTLNSFTGMMASRDYETLCDPQRVAGCERHVIVCTEESYSKFKPPSVQPPEGNAFGANYQAGSIA